MKIAVRIFSIVFLLIINSKFIYAQTETEMVFVKGGTFKMGDNNGDHDEKPKHTVKVSSFYIGKYEVTVKQYKEYCSETGTSMPGFPENQWYEEHDEAGRWVWKNNNPITYVTWKDAVNYTKWLSKKTGKNYSLPTEAQWEFAAKGGIKSKHFKFSGSDNIQEVAWFDETTYERSPMPVGRLKPNELGIYDMSGNAWEWCLDHYSYYKSGSRKDPKGPSKGSFRVIRGGSWYYVESLARVTARDGPYPHYTNYNYGFRVVINP